MREMQGNWRDIFMAFRVALDPKKLLLCFLGLALSFFLTMLLLMVIGSAIDPELSIWTWEKTLRQWFCANCDAIYQSPPVTWSLFTLVLVVVNSLFWSYFGGATTRLAALQVTKDESLELDKAMKFSHRKYSSYFWSVGACVAGFLFFMLVVSAVSLLGAIPWGIGSFLSIFLMLGYPLAVLAGFLMTLIAIGTVFGSSLFYPAISAEGTDAFDAISRGFGYVYTRPWHYIFYQLVALGHGIVSVGFVYLFGYLMLTFTDASGFSMGKTFHNITNIWIQAPDSGLQALAGYIYAFWYSLVGGLVLSYGLSYFFSAQTIIYFLLRKKVDGIEVNEVYEEKEELPSNLPQEAPGPQAGAPVVAAAPAAAPAAPPAPPAPPDASAPPPTGSGS